MHQNNKINADIHSIKEQLVSISNALATLQDAALHTKEFLDNQEFIQLMHISKRTAQYWRDSGLIPFSQIGNKLYYKMADVLIFIDTYKKS